MMVETDIHGSGQGREDDEMYGKRSTLWFHEADRLSDPAWVSLSERCTSFRSLIALDFKGVLQLPVFWLIHPFSLGPQGAFLLSDQSIRFPPTGDGAVVHSFDAELLPEIAQALLPPFLPIDA